MNEALSSTIQGGVSMRVGVRAQIQSTVPSLPASDQKVAQTVLKDADAVLHYSVSDMARAAGTAPSTVVRACQRLGFRGFQHLKIALAQELGAVRGDQNGSEDVHGDHSLNRSMEASISAIRDIPHLLSLEEFEAAVSALVSARSVLLVGAGQSQGVVQDACYRLQMIGLLATAPSDLMLLQQQARTLTDRDVCLAISHTGATRHVLTACEDAAAQGATTIAITSFRQSPITGIVKIRLIAGGYDLGFRLESMASRLAHMCLVDALYLAAAARLDDRATVALDAMADVQGSHLY